MIIIKSLEDTKQIKEAGYPSNLYKVIREVAELQEDGNYGITYITDMTPEIKQLEQEHHFNFNQPDYIERIGEYQLRQYATGEDFVINILF